jgi:hypothetical protein
VRAGVSSASACRGKPARAGCMRAASAPAMAAYPPGCCCCGAPSLHVLASDRGRWIMQEQRCTAGDAGATAGGLGALLARAAPKLAATAASASALGAAAGAAADAVAVYLLVAALAGEVGLGGSGSDVGPWQAVQAAIGRALGRRAWGGDEL